MALVNALNIPTIKDMKVLQDNHSNNRSDDKNYAKDSSSTNICITDSDNTSTNSNESSDTLFEVSFEMEVVVQNE